jgi:hypothetical protein
MNSWIIRPLKKYDKKTTGREGTVSTVHKSLDSPLFPLSILKIEDQQQSNLSYKAHHRVDK